MLLWVLALYKSHDPPRSSDKDGIDIAKLRQIAREEITKNCHKEAKKKRIDLDCTRLDVGEPKQLEGTLIDPVEFSVWGGVDDSNGELIWSGSVNLYPTGKITMSEATYLDPTTNEYISETRILDQ
jgi:hypothetical protein